MTRRFKTADYEKTLDLQISLREALPEDHLGRFIVDSISELDLSSIYREYAELAAPTCTPEILFPATALELHSCRALLSAQVTSILSHSYPFNHFFAPIYHLISPILWS